MRANDPIHWQIELYLKGNGLYYDRRKNYYKNQGKKSAQIISVSFLSQCMISLVLHKPDAARARPSTLLIKDETYNSLYNSNQDLDVFYHAAKLGRMTEICLKRMSEYSQAQVNDILFYTLYYEVGQLLHKDDIMAADIKALDLTVFTDDYILYSAKIVFEEYSRLGGNSQVAKGSLLIERLKRKIVATSQVTEEKGRLAIT